MSFPLVKPGGWATAATLTATQVNQLQGYLSNALNGVQEDTLSGAVTIANGGSVTVAGSGTTYQSSGSQTLPGAGTTFVFNLVSASGLPTSGSIWEPTSGAHIAYANISGNQLQGCTSSSTATIAGGTSMLVYGRILVGSNGKIVVQSGGSLSTSAGSTVFFGNTPQFSAGANISGGNVITANGSGARIVHADADYPVLDATSSHPGRVQTMRLNLAQIVGSAPVSGQYTPGIYGLVIAATPPAAFNIALPSFWNGAALTAATLYFYPNNGHGSLPSTGPSFQITQQSLAVGSTYPSSSAGIAIASSYSLTGETTSTWNNRNVRALNAGIVGSPVGSRSSIYWLNITDEAGGGAITGTTYVALDLTYGIADLRPQ